MRPAEIYKSYDFMAYISRSADFGHFCMVKIFDIGRFRSSTDCSKLIFY